MLDHTRKEPALIEELNTQIDYRYYDERARSLRSEAAWGFLKGLFPEKKTSSVKIPDRGSSMMASVLAVMRCKYRPCVQA